MFPLYYPLYSSLGEIPIVVLHNHDVALDMFIQEVWERKFGYDTQADIWRFGASQTGYEPFYGMTERQVIDAVKRVARRLQYRIEANFETIVKAHISILGKKDMSFSLTGFQYLCGFQNMNEFHHNILLCFGEREGKRVWADLDANSDQSGQFNLFRTVIDNLVADAAWNGWADDDRVDNVNCISALRENRVIMLDINPFHSDFFLNYLTEELQCGFPFVFILDGVSFGTEILDFLQRMSQGSFVLMGDNVTGLYKAPQPQPTKTLWLDEMAEKSRLLILLKHRTGPAATVFSQIVSEYEAEKASSSSDYTYERHHLLASGYRTGTNIGTQDEARLKPQDLMNLYPGQAVVFDTATNQLIYFYP